MTPSISVTLVNQISEVERLSRLVEAFGEAEGLGPEAVFSMNLALDEVVTNVKREVEMLVQIHAFRAGPIRTASQQQLRKLWRLGCR